MALIVFLCCHFRGCIKINYLLCKLFESEREMLMKMLVVSDILSLETWWLSTSTSTRSR